MTRCFVIGPIGNKLAALGTPGRTLYEEALEVYEDVIRPACQANGLDPVRADGIALPGEITEQIFRHLYEDEVVIADVSGGNQNVMYELGLRHTRDLLTIQIGEYGQLPFDVNTVRTIQFSRSERGLIDARNQLEQALRVGLAEGGDPLTATRIWSSRGDIDVALRDPAESTPESTELEIDPDEDGLLERIGKIESQFPQMTAILEEIGEVIETLGASAVTFSSEFDLLNASEVSSSQRLTIIAKFGQTLHEPADELTRLTDKFADEMESTDLIVKGILRDLAATPSADEEGVFPETVIELAASSREAMEGLNQFGTQVSSLGHLSRSLRRPGLQMGKAIRKMAEAAAVMDEWEAKAIELRMAMRRSPSTEISASEDL